MQSPIFSNASQVFSTKLELYQKSQNELLKSKTKEIEDLIASISAESITPDGVINFEVVVQDEMHEQTVRLVIQGLTKSGWRVDRKEKVLHISYTPPPVQNPRI